MATFVTLPNKPRSVKATEARLCKIYEAARMGLRGESLAIMAGVSPEEYRLMSDMDHMVRMVELQGAADSEMEHASLLAERSREGDVKATLAILERKHGWIPKSEVGVTTRNIDADKLKTLTTDEIKSMLFQGEYTVVHDDPTIGENTYAD